jgi:DNA (cytosine-5)-methyltransferase 1
MALTVHEPRVAFDQVSLFETKAEYCSGPIPNFSGRTISLFSGAGGLDLGLEKAGFETLACVEFDPNSRATLRKNRPNWKLVSGSGVEPGDIRHVSGEEILAETGLKLGEVDLLAGGPPCQSFSNMGLRRGEQDPKNGDLYLHYLRLVRELQPRGIIFENVEGFNHEQHRAVRTSLLSQLEALGYTLATGVLVAADYGDPQVRRRFVVIGVLGEEAPRLPIPTHFESTKSHHDFCIRTGIQVPFQPYVTVRDAFDQMERNRAQIPFDLKMGVSDVVLERMKYIGPGQNFKVLPEELLPNCWKSGRHQGADTFGRLRLDRPSVTIRTSGYNPAKGRYIHPTENRGLSTAEMAALQSFPPEYEFVCSTGRPTLVGVGRMIGNAVPINLATALGRSVARCLASL